MHILFGIWIVAWGLSLAQDSLCAIGLCESRFSCSLTILLSIYCSGFGSLDTVAHELIDLTHLSADLDCAYMFCICFGIQILTFKMYLHMKLIWLLCMVICWFYGSFWILVMSRVSVVSVGHLKRALSIFGHGPGIHLNTSELFESRFLFWFSFYSLTLYVLIKFTRIEPKCPWIWYCNLVFRMVHLFYVTYILLASCAPMIHFHA